MLKTRKWLILVISILLSLLLSVSLAEENKISFYWIVEDSTIELFPIEVQKNNRVLFIPGALPASDAKMYISTGDSVMINNVTIHSDETIDLSQCIGDVLSVFDSNNKTLDTFKVMQGSPIPALFFTLSDNDNKRVHGSQHHVLDIRDPASMVMVEKDGSVSVSSAMNSFHIRGNSTRFASKHPYQFKLDKKTDLGGMGKAKTWILLANWFDVSLLRNQITLDLCREIGLNYTPDCCQTDVYINGCYNGTYLLTEKIQLHKHRLQITNMEDELKVLNSRSLDSYEYKKSTKYNAASIRWFELDQEPQDITGGFLLQMEKALQFSRITDASGFKTDGNMCVVIKEPSQAGFEATNYIAGLVNEMHNAVLSKDGLNKDTGKHYTEYIDTESFALKVMIEELSGNFDARAASQFMYKDADSIDNLIYAGPAWDYDLTYGTKHDGLVTATMKDYVYKRSQDTSNLYHYLLDHDEFKKTTRELFESRLLPAVQILLGRKSPENDSYVRSFTEYRDSIASSAGMNFVRWDPRLISDLNKEASKGFISATAYLNNWISQRIDMMTDSWLK